jgi:hypothetical protein
MWDAILQKLAEFALPWILHFAQQFPVVSAILMGMAMFRVVMKPIFSALPNFVKTTPWDWDNALLQKVLNSKAYPVVAWLFDYLTSIKLPQKPEEAKPVEVKPAA